MLIGQREGDNKPPATVALSALNFGAYPMSNDLTRLQSRFLGEPARVEKQRPKSAPSSTDRTPKRSALSPSRSTTSTGTTRSGCSWRNA
jgi:hypothetical protein